ncbi:MAG: response regulator receiver modulated CheB methylesterase [Gemmatimonadetes bacterium]|nr:response regulator receiver modulated CheB methylesterase [Gemmatimonadota bacterium]
MSEEASAPAPLRVLVVDDSAVAREVLTTALRRDPLIEVITAPTGAIALERIRQHRPQVILLDLELPGMSGLVLLETVMAHTPTPVVVCSGSARPGAAAAVRALELGAIDILPKPEGGIREFLNPESSPLVTMVRAAASARVRSVALPSAPAWPPPAPHPAARPGRVWRGLVFVIGASTGGTEAVRTILRGLPGDAPPVVVVQHMPAAFTGAFAHRLNSLSAMDVREARDGDVLQQGVALIAPGGRQLQLGDHATNTTVRIRAGDPVSGHCPSVDVLFRSAATALGARAVGVILTGMGADGADGLLRMRLHGARTFAQDERSCVVFGMPREAIARGGVESVLTLDDIPRELARLIRPASTRQPV